MKNVLNIFLWIVIICWAGVCLYDFYNVRHEKEARFCIKEETKEYNDGNVYVCTGPGYKVFKYKRLKYNAIEFAPFWTKEKIFND